MSASDDYDRHRLRTATKYFKVSVKPFQRLGGVRGGSPEKKGLGGARGGSPEKKTYGARGAPPEKKLRSAPEKGKMTKFDKKF